MPFVLWAPYWLPLGPLAFLAYIVTTLAAENRVPFDILEAESELIAGFRVEYSGMKFALIQLGEYAHVIGPRSWARCCSSARGRGRGRTRRPDGAPPGSCSR